jgi:hypothetical protein
VIVWVNEIPEDVVSRCPDECREDALIPNPAVAPNTVHTQQSGEYSDTACYTVRQQEAIGFVRIYVYVGVDLDWNSVHGGYSRVHATLTVSLRRESRVQVQLTSKMERIAC